MTDARKISRSNGRVCAFDQENQLIGNFRTRVEATRALNLTQQADAMLKRARCDAVTRARQDRRYRRNKRAESKRFARLRRAKRKKLGNLGAASPVKTIPPDAAAGSD
jgi:hypothetical protein